MLTNTFRVYLWLNDCNESANAELLSKEFITEMFLAKKADRVRKLILIEGAGYAVFCIK